jgi:hypothetical protein
MSIDILWIVIGSILLLVGIIGCILPVLPGQIIAWSSLLILQLSSPPPFTAKFIVTWALITAAVTIFDYVVPVWGTKKLGGTKRGIWGATLGLVAAIFVFPVLGIVIGPFGVLGIIIGPFAGAYIGESTGGADRKIAFKSAMGSFIGFLAGTALKLIISIYMGVYFVKHSYNYFSQALNF